MTGLINMVGLLLQAAREEFLFYNDKYNAVLIVLAIVLIGIFGYLIFTGARLRKVETELKRLEEKRQQQQD